MKTSIALILCLFWLASCEKNIKIDLPAPPPKLVMNAVVRVGDSITVNLSRSAGIKESSQQAPRVVPGAVVILYVDGQAKDTLQTTPGGYDVVFTSKVKAEHGKTYRLTATAKGYDPVEASASAPGAVHANSWDYKPNALQRNNGGSYDELGIEFPDPAGRDYYIVRIVESYQRFEFYDRDFYDWGGCAYSSDPSLESPTSDPFGGDNCIPMNSILLNDALFNGQKKHLSMYVSSGALQTQQDTSGKKIYAKFYLYHVSEDFYKYVKTFRAALDADGNPFAEPVNVSTNVKNGYGIFAILDEYMEEIKI